MESRCSPESMLTKVMLKHSPQEPAIRLGQWSGFDMSTVGGMNRAREFRKQHNFQHLWVAVPCGP
jgi:hypothetical protein